MDEEELPRVVSDEIRYQAKAVTDAEWISGFLAEQPTGVLGVVDGDGPHLVTQLFVHDEPAGAVYLHGAQAGRVYEVVAASQPAPACFTTSWMGRFIPAPNPVNFTVEYRSVVAYGTIGLVTDPAAKRGVLELFMEKFAPHLHPGVDYEPIATESIDRTAVYEFAVESWSGKEGLKDPDHPGAYTLPEAEYPDTEE